MDFLKEVFGTEALTYDKLAEKLKGNESIKLGNLADGAYVSKEKFAALEAARDGLKTQLDAAAGEIKSYKDMDIDGIKKQATEWEGKYNADTQALKDQLDAANYGFAVKEAASGLKFTSESARKAFVADLTAKKLPLQDGKLLGLDDFAKEYRTGDPGAFAAEDDDKTPVATRGGTGGNLPAGGEAALRAAMGLPVKTE